MAPTKGKIFGLNFFLFLLTLNVYSSFQEEEEEEDIDHLVKVASSEASQKQRRSGSSMVSSAGSVAVTCWGAQVRWNYFPEQSQDVGKFCLFFWVKPDAVVCLFQVRP